MVTAYDVDTGRELWARGWDGEFKEWMGGDGPRATPTWFDGRVYALGALGELRALDERTGAMFWRVNILDDNAATNLPWGMAASPLIVDDLVLVLPGGPAGRSVAAYDRQTGARRWTALNDKQAYLVADACHDRRHAADPHRHRLAPRGADPNRRAAVAVSVADRE